MLYPDVDILPTYVLKIRNLIQYSEAERAGNLDQLDQVNVSTIAGHHYFLHVAWISIGGLGGGGGYLVGGDLRKHPTLSSIAFH